MSETTLRELIQAEIDKVEHKNDVKPACIAHPVYLRIDPDGIAPPLVSFAAHSDLKQRTRAIIAQEVRGRRFPRYPRKLVDPDDEPSYRSLELLSDEDIDFNIERLESHAAALLRHVDALRAWKDARAA